MDERDFFDRISKVPNQFLPDGNPGLVPDRATPPMSVTSVPPVPARGVPPVPARGLPPVPARGVPLVPARGVPPLPARGVPPVPARGVPPVPGRGVPPVPARTVPTVPARTVPPMLPDRALPPVPYRPVPPVPQRALPPVPDRAVSPVPDIISGSMHHAANSAHNVPRTYRRVPIPVQQQYMPSTANSEYPSGACPLHHPRRADLNMNMGGFNSRDNSDDAYGRPMANQFRNLLWQVPAVFSSMVVAVAEYYRRTFDSFQNVVEILQTINVFLETVHNVMQITHQITFGVAENYARVRTVSSNLYSLIVSVKSIKWFLTSMFNFLRIVRRGSSAEENFSTTQENIPSDIFTA